MSLKATPWNPSHAGYYQSILGSSPGDKEFYAVAQDPSNAFYPDIAADKIADQVRNAVVAHIDEEPIRGSIKINKRKLIRESDEIIVRADKTLRELYRIAPETPLDPHQKVILEAIILATGRPSLFVREGKVDTAPKDARLWRDQIEVTQSSSAFSNAISAVGRINQGMTPRGTGFLIGSDLIMTNRHVARTFAAKRNGSWTFGRAKPVIDFHCERGCTTSSKFRIVEVVEEGTGSGEEGMESFHYLDLMLLRIEPIDDATPPEPLAIASSIDVNTFNGMVLVVGFPAKPTTLPNVYRASLSDPWAVVERLFGEPYGVKRVAPGYVISAPGDDPLADPNAWIIEHDASTLAGSSGSCVIPLSDPSVVIGLHFAGEWFASNYAHAMHKLPKLKGTNPAMFRAI